MGEPQTIHFYDIGILGRVPEPQNQLFRFFETQDTSMNPTKITNSFRDIFLQI